MSLRYVLLSCLIFACLSAAAQQKKTDTTTIDVPGAKASFPCTLKYDYSMADSTRIFDGAFSINGSKDANGLKETYSLKGFASRNQLDGDVEADYTLEGQADGEKHFIVFSYKGAFQDGLPHGEMTITSFGQGAGAYDVRMNFDKGVLTGQISFKAFAKKEFMISGNFTSGGEMAGEWKTGRYDVKAHSAERSTFSISDGIKISGTGYTKELEEAAKKYKDGKLTEEELDKKGIAVRTIEESDLEKVIKGAIRNRFIPFESLASMDLSKVAIRYKALAYFPCLNEKGLAGLLDEIDSYDGYRQPELSTFGINLDSKEKSLCKVYDKSLEAYITNPEWDESQQCEVHFSQGQIDQIAGRIEAAQKKWRNSAIALCNSNVEVLIEQYLLHKTPSEISQMMTNAAKKGYKVEADHSASRYEGHAPVVGFESLGMKASADSTAAHKFVSRINVKNTDSLGFRTYEWYIRLRSTDPKDLLNDVNDSFSPENFTRVGNQYDTINSLIGAIDRHSKEFQENAKKAMMNPIADYAAYIQQICKVDESDLEGSAARLQQVLKFQEDFDKWLQKSIELKESDDKITAKGADTPKVNEGYTKYMKHADISWSPSNSLENLIRVEEIQKSILQYIESSCRIAENTHKIRKCGSKHHDLTGQYKKYLKEQDIKWHVGADLKQLDTILDTQAKTLEFISRRDSILLNNKKIEDCKNRYDILEQAYHKYFKNADLSWTPDVNIEKLDTVIAIQNRTLEFINLRDRIVENHENILQEGKRYRRVITAYSEYAKNVDVAWTPEVNLAKLEAIIAIQDSCSTIFSMQNRKDVNKTIKQEKLKDIADIIERLNKK